MELQKTNGHEQRITDKELISFLDNLGLTSKLNEGEKNTYLSIAKAFGLNPFKREIHVSKYADQMSIITGYEVYIKRAERSGALDGWSVRTEGKPEDNSLKAIITIHRKDRKHPFEHEVYYSEYVQKTKDGTITKFWQKPYTMIKKVAMSQGFRLCFSDELGGMPYTPEEMPEPSTHDIKHEVIIPEIEEYFNLVSSAGHVLNKEEQQSFLFDKNGIQYTDWTQPTLKAGIKKLNKIIMEREEKILSDEHAKSEAKRQEAGQ